MSRITNVLDLFVFALVLAVLVQLQNSFCSSSKELTLDDVNEEETSITQDNSTSSQHDPCRKCHKMHRGILRRVTDPGKRCDGAWLLIQTVYIFQTTFLKVAWCTLYCIVTHLT